MTRPEEKHIRKQIRAALKAGGIDICPAKLLDSLTKCALDLVLEDRSTSAEIVLSAARAHGTLDVDQLTRLAEVVEERIEEEPGVVTIETEDE